jgi:hypothetical protein
LVAFRFGKATLRLSGKSTCGKSAFPAAPTFRIGLPGRTRQAIVDLQRAGLARVEITAGGPCGKVLEVVFDMDAIIGMVKATSH